MQTPRIRPANESDADSVSALLTTLGYPVSSEVAASRLQRFLSSLTQLVFVAVRDHEVVGLVAISFGATLHLTGPIARITALVVDPASRNRQIGKALIQQAVNIAKEKDCAGLEATTGLERLEAHRFYLRNGFSLTSNRFYRTL